MHWKRSQSGKQNLFMVQALLLLAYWQVRQTWRLLTLVGVGMLVATVLMCASPLYSHLVLNASLYDFFQTHPQRTFVVLPGSLLYFNEDTFARNSERLNQLATRDVGPLLSTPARQLIQTSPMIVVPLTSPPTEVFVDGFAQRDLSQRARPSAGRWPRSVSTPEVLEIAVSSSTLQAWHLHLGDTISVAFSRDEAESGTVAWRLQIVGVFEQPSDTDPFWQGHATDFQISPEHRSVTGVLASQEALAQLPGLKDPRLLWTYSIDRTRLDASHIDDLVTGLQRFLHDSKDVDLELSIDTPSIKSPLGELQFYQQHLALARLCVDLLLLFIVGMILLFVILMADLLVEQRRTTIALLRSRGASYRQVGTIFVFQGLLLVLISLLIGPLLALPLAYAMTRIFAPYVSSVVLETAYHQGFSLVSSTYPLALLTCSVSLLTLIAMLIRDMRLDMLTLRRETGRSTRRPVWQRFYLDGVLLLLAIATYLFTLFMSPLIGADSQLNARLVPPLALAASACFLLSLLLFFLRLFPFLLRWAMEIASRRNNAASMLALAQMARNPQRSLRATLLLTVTTAFVIFALVFSATQEQRLLDVVTLELGADISGHFSSSISAETVSQQTQVFQRLPGVAAITFGTIINLSQDQQSIAVKAVDAETFAQTANWSTHYSSPPVRWMPLLAAQRGNIQLGSVIPALVDGATAQHLHLEAGKSFQLQTTYLQKDSDPTTLTFTFKVLDIVEHLLGLDTSNQINSGNATQQSILVDFQTMAKFYRLIAAPFATINPGVPSSLTANTLWVHARPGSNLTAVRTALQQKLGADAVLYDQESFMTLLRHDPFYLNVRGIISLGIVAPLFLAFLGSLLASWLTAQERLTVFALLRALGSVPRQLAGILGWEQGIVYGSIFILAILAGIVLSVLALPTLVLTEIVAVGITGDSPTIVNAAPFQEALPALQVVVPPLLLGLLITLILVSLLALAMMITMLVRPSTSQLLRLNTD